MRSDFNKAIIEREITGLEEAEQRARHLHTRAGLPADGDVAAAVYAGFAALVKAIKLIAEDREVQS